MNPNLEMLLSRLHDTFGARVGRASVYGGVIAVPTALAPTEANLAALRQAWRSDDEERSEARR